MDNKKSRLMWRISGLIGAIVLGVSIILQIITSFNGFYIGMGIGIIIMIFTILMNRFKRKQQPDERYKSIMEKASYVTLMVLFIAGPIILCTMFFIGTFSSMKNLVTMANILTLPIIVLCIIYYIAVFYYRKKLGN